MNWEDECLFLPPGETEAPRSARGRWGRMAAAVLVAGFGLTLPTGSLTPADAFGLTPIRLCQLAIASAYQTHDIPAGLLEAIGAVESGRTDGATGARGPWPWTINAEGQDHYFPDKESAIAAVQELHARGVASIDVGCMQVNLMYHPEAFASLDDAFDPVTNVAYAADFLTRLHDEAADWMRATGNYHSRTPELGASYADRVRNAIDAGSGDGTLGGGDFAGAVSSGFAMGVEFAHPYYQGLMAGADVVALPGPDWRRAAAALRGASVDAVIVSLPRPHRASAASRVATPPVSRDATDGD